jgi:hypothetical protein
MFFKRIFSIFILVLLLELKISESAPKKKGKFEDLFKCEKGSTCEPYFLCGDEIETSNDGRYQIDERSITFKPTEKTCIPPGKVCCKNPVKIIKNIIHPTTNASEKVKTYTQSYPDIFDCEEGMSCLYLFQCDDEFENDGGGKIDERTTVESKCGAKKICCKPSNLIGVGPSTSRPQTLITSTSRTTTTIRSVAFTTKEIQTSKETFQTTTPQPNDKDTINVYLEKEEYQGNDINNIDLFATFNLCKQLSKRNVPKKCGHRNEDGLTDRKYDMEGRGSLAQYGEHPYMLALLKNFNEIEDSDEETEFVCGATLIHPSFALTAAHCIKRLEAEDFIVRGGEWNSRNTEEVCPHQDRNVSNIFICDGYERINLHNDIALLQLDKPFELNSLINTICLPEKDKQHHNNKFKCIASGWGAENFDKSSIFQEFLKNYPLEPYSHEDCTKIIRNLLSNKNYTYFENFFCTGGKDGHYVMKKGDGGGPLVSYKSRRCEKNN